MGLFKGLKGKVFKGENSLFHKIATPLANAASLIPGVGGIVSTAIRKADSINQDRQLQKIKDAANNTAPSGGGVSDSGQTDQGSKKGMFAIIGGLILAALVAVFAFGKKR